MESAGGDDDDDDDDNGLSVWSAHVQISWVLFGFYSFSSSPACKPSILNKSGLMCFVCFQFQARLRHPKTSPQRSGSREQSVKSCISHQQRATQRGHSHAPRRFVVCCTLLAQMRRDPATCASLIKIPKQLLSFLFVNQITLRISQRSHTRNSRGLVKCDDLLVL